MIRLPKGPHLPPSPTLQRGRLSRPPQNRTHRPYLNRMLGVRPCQTPTPAPTKHPSSVISVDTRGCSWSHFAGIHRQMSTKYSGNCLSIKIRRLTPPPHPSHFACAPRQAPQCLAPDSKCWRGMLVGGRDGGGGARDGSGRAEKRRVRVGGQTMLARS